MQALSVFALLDLLSRGEIRVHQAQVFGDIVVQASRNQSDRLRGRMTEQASTQTGAGVRLADLRRDVEALLFAAGDPLTVDSMLQALGVDDATARRAVEQILEELAAGVPRGGRRGASSWSRLAGGWAFRTNPPLRERGQGPVRTALRSRPTIAGGDGVPGDSGLSAAGHAGHRSRRSEASTPTRPSALCWTESSSPTSDALRPKGGRCSMRPPVASRRCSVWPT